MRILTWLCAAVALVAILAFVLQSWQLVLFALGMSAVVAYVAGRFTSNRRHRS